jgi:hypothetical protein
MRSRPFSLSLNPFGIRALELHVIRLKDRTNSSFIIVMGDEKSNAEICFRIGSKGIPRRRPCSSLNLVMRLSAPLIRIVVLSLQPVLATIQSDCIMESASKPGLTPKERIDLIRAELESIKASTARQKWEMLELEMQDIKDDLSDEIQTGLKDSTNMMGDLGKRLSKLELQVDELTKALGKISEATAEASSKSGH